MKKLALAFFLVVYGMTSVFSQEKKLGAEISEIRKNKNQVDIDIKNIFNGLGNATLLYKRAYQSGNLVNVNAIQLIRFSAQINNQITFTDDPTRESSLEDANVVFHPSNLMNIQLGIGYERQQMNKNFVHYYGVDGVFNFFQSDDDYANGYFGGVTNNHTGTTDRLIKTFRAGVNPFFGIKYYFTNNISIGIETGFAVLYFNQAITEVDREQELFNGEFVNTFVEDTPTKSSGIQTRFNNLRFLTIGYAF